MQSDAGRRLLQTHGLDPSNPVSFLLLDGNLAYTDTTAIVRVLEYLGGMWKVVAKIISWIPRSIRDPVYRFVARHRYKIFGRRSECVVPAPELARRFIQD
jgi:predicted DCC family thiol-disulfide oxidoreductase YuxK